MPTCVHIKLYTDMYLKSLQTSDFNIGITICLYLSQVK